jgi:hypothetical protein
MRNSTQVILTASLFALAGCGGDAAAPTANDSAPGGSAAYAANADGGNSGASGSSSSSRASSSASSSQAPAPAKAHAPLPGRDMELANPDDATMILLYHDLAGIATPLDTWVERDFRIVSARAPDKAAQRAMVRSEFEASMAAVRSVGSLRLSMPAQISDYDPTYNEFGIRALSPSSTVTYRALNSQVNLRFTNGRDAQIWQVPPAEAQVISDKMGPYGNATLDVLLRITGTQPAPNGGTILTEVLEYELRSTNKDILLGRVVVAR